MEKKDRIGFINFIYSQAKKTVSPGNNLLILPCYCISIKLDELTCQLKDKTFKILQEIIHHSVHVKNAGKKIEKRESEKEKQSGAIRCRGRWTKTAYVTWRGGFTKMS